MSVNKYFSVFSSKNKNFLLNKTDIFFEIPNKYFNDLDNYIDDFLKDKFQQNIIIKEMRKILKVEEFGDTDVYYLIEVNDFLSEQESLNLNSLVNSNFHNLDLFLESFISKEFIHVKNL